MCTQINQFEAVCIVYTDKPVEAVCVHRSCIVYTDKPVQNQKSTKNIITFRKHDSFEASLKLLLKKRPMSESCDLVFVKKI